MISFMSSHTETFIDEVKEMVFFYQNCSVLLREKFAEFLRSLEQFIQTVKGQNNFW